MLPTTSFELTRLCALGALCATGAGILVFRISLVISLEGFLTAGCGIIFLYRLKLGCVMYLILGSTFGAPVDRY
jgi:hypothetical protein